MTHIEAMKRALEAMRSYQGDRLESGGEINLEEEIKALEEALAKQEHDLQDKRCECCGYMTYQREHMGCIRSAKQEQSTECVGEPVAECVDDGEGGVYYKTLAPKAVLGKLYATPYVPEGRQPAEREPLTDDEIERIWQSLPFCNWFRGKFARAIEAAHGIKE